MYKILILGIHFCHHRRHSSFRTRCEISRSCRVLWKMSRAQRVLGKDRRWLCETPPPLCARRCETRRSQTLRPQRVDDRCRRQWPAVHKCAAPWSHRAALAECRASSSRRWALAIHAFNVSVRRNNLNPNINGSPGIVIIATLYGSFSRSPRSLRNTTTRGV